MLNSKQNSTFENNMSLTPISQAAKKRFRDEFSLAQVFASILSAVTCMFLAPQIGVIGGVIGVGLAAGVSAIASQAYKILLNATKDSLKNKQYVQDSTANHEELPTPKSGALHHNHEVIHSENNPYMQPTSPRRLNMQYIALLIVVSLLSIGLTYFAVMYLTQGEGLGTKPQIIYITQTDVHDTNKDTSEHTNQNKTLEEADTPNNNSTDSTAQQPNGTHSEQSTREEATNQENNVQDQSDNSEQNIPNDSSSTPNPDQKMPDNQGKTP